MVLPIQTDNYDNHVTIETSAHTWRRRHLAEAFLDMSTRGQGGVGAAGQTGQGRGGESWAVQGRAGRAGLVRITEQTRSHSPRKQRGAGGQSR